MARQRGGQSGRTAGRENQDPAQDLGGGDAEMQGGAASGGATLGGSTERASTYGGDAYGENSTGSGYGSGAYGGGASGGASGGGSYGAGAGGGFAQGGGAQGGAQGGGMMDEAKHKAQQLASEAQDKAGEKVQSGLTSGKNRAAETLNSVAQSLYTSSQQLREQDQGGVSRYVEQAAGRVERAANYLQQTDVNQMVDQVENFARRNPAVFLGGAFALGLLGARFLKSSRSKAYGDVPHDRSLVPYRAGYDRTTGYERAADFPRASGGLADRGSWGAAGATGATGATGASATGDRGLSATGGTGMGGPGSYDDTGYGRTDFGGTTPGTGGDDRF